MSASKTDTKPLVSIGEASRRMGIGRDAGYRMARDGTFPVPIIDTGPRARRVRVADIDRWLNGARNGAEH